jgi:polysaccharide deactylase family protein, PEP-CTERM locus subfamily
MLHVDLPSVSIFLVAAFIDLRPESVFVRGSQIHHHFTVDVEEYFQVSAFERFVRRDSWTTIESRLHIGMRRLLDLTANLGVRGTFFTLGWIARHHPDVVRELANAGHEVASHGWGHERVTTLTPDEFRRSVRDSKAILEDLTGLPVFGYRAPSFSIVRGREWALDILVEEGYRYDSSLFPVRRSGYGYADGNPDPHRITREVGGLDELPPATLRVGRRLFPAGGGAYFRLFPYMAIRRAFDAAERRGVPATFYIHPWELDPDQPRLPVPIQTRARHYGGLTRTIPRLERLLHAYRFQPIAATLGLRG